MKHGKIVASPGIVDNIENILVTTTSYYSLCTQHIYGTQWDAAESISGSSNLHCTLGSVELSIVFLCIQAYICGLWP